VKASVCRNLFLGLLSLVPIIAFAFSFEFVRDGFWFLLGKLRGGYTVAERLEQLGPIVEARLRRTVESAGLVYPPRDIAYVAFKDSRRLEVYGRMAAEEPWRFVKAYSILALSGKPGPKLMEGDYQVPEGIYRAEFLNANSRFHLAIRLDYPNEFDKEMALADARDKLGGDIMIHGSSVSIGCLAMGNRAVEDLFILAALASKERVRIVIAPTDFRVAAPLIPIVHRDWIDSLYADLEDELQQFPKGT
jgi:hypothetical protein